MDERTQLTDSQRETAGRIFGSAPAIALPRGGQGRRPQTVEEVLDMLETITDCLKRTMAEKRGLSEEHALLVADLDAVARVVKRFGVNP